MKAKAEVFGCMKPRKLPGDTDSKKRHITISFP